MVKNNKISVAKRRRCSIVLVKEVLNSFYLLWAGLTKEITWCPKQISTSNYQEHRFKMKRVRDSWIGPDSLLLTKCKIRQNKWIKVKLLWRQRCLKNKRKRVRRSKYQLKRKKRVQWICIKIKVLKGRIIIEIKVWIVIVNQKTLNSFLKSKKAKIAKVQKRVQNQTTSSL